MTIHHHFSCNLNYYFKELNLYSWMKIWNKFKIIFVNSSTPKAVLADRSIGSPSNKFWEVCFAHFNSSWEALLFESLSDLFKRICIGKSYFSHQAMKFRSLSCRGCLTSIIRIMPLRLWHSRNLEGLLIFLKDRHWHWKSWWIEFDQVCWKSLLAFFDWLTCLRRSICRSWSGRKWRAQRLRRQEKIALQDRIYQS